MILALKYNLYFKDRLGNLIVKIFVNAIFKLKENKWYILC